MPGNKSKPLKVALLNTTDLGGGAETVVRMLRDGLARRGHNPFLWVGRRRGGDSRWNTVELPRTASQRQAARRYARKGFYSLGLPSSQSFCDSPALSPVDVVHLHNLHGHYLSITALPRLAERKPLVWTLHDYFAITGGCAFPFSCDRWKSRCGNCPELGHYPIDTPYDRTRRLQSIKRWAFRDLPVHLIAPSRHLARAVEQSGVFAAAEVQIIPYGVDTKLFSPHRRSARQGLELSDDRPVVLVVAQGLDDPRKGIGPVFEALRRVKDRKLTVLVAGAGPVEPIVEALSPHEVRPLGYVKDSRALARYYAAADLFLFPSRAENYPCVVMEAMACGTAVLAFDIDGVNEQIRSNQTGFLVPQGDRDGFARTLGQLLHNVQRLRAVGQAARQHAEREWNVERFLDRHERLYEQVLSAQ